VKGAPAHGARSVAISPVRRHNEMNTTNQPNIAREPGKIATILLVRRRCRECAGALHEKTRSMTAEAVNGLAGADLRLDNTNV